MKKKKVMFISSTGGHMVEMLKLKNIFSNYNYSLVTEKVEATAGLKKIHDRTYYLIYGTKDHMLSYPFKLLINLFISLFIYIIERPQFIITTGAHTAGPMCCIGKLFGSRIIYIETMANMSTKTITGRILYKFADIFIVQWNSMLELYPKAIVCSSEDLL